MRARDLRIYELAKPYLNIRHNDVHVPHSYEFALKLLEFEPGDEDIILPAVLCHDLGWMKVPEELHLRAFGPFPFDVGLQRLHEVEGVKLAQAILEAENYDPVKVDEILQIIDGHDTRLEALSDNDKIVKDADKLFRFHPLGLEIDANRFQVEKDAHIQWLMSKIENWFFTETGKRLAWEEIAKS